jgi:hypothetical protein
MATSPDATKVAVGAFKRSPPDNSTFSVVGLSLVAAASELSENALATETTRKKLRRDLSRILGNVIFASMFGNYTTFPAPRI